jgi:hypothetical protein
MSWDIALVKYGAALRIKPNSEQHSKRFFLPLSQLSRLLADGDGVEIH